MNKTATCIMLLNLLASNTLLNKTEIADILEINPRNVPEYIKELQIAGYDIITQRGVYGGYRLNKEASFAVAPLTKKEIASIESGIYFLKNQSDFLDKNEYLKAMGKVLNSQQASSSAKNIATYERFPLQMSIDELKKRYEVINQAMEDNNKLVIEYLSQKNKISKHIVHPYNAFIYNGAWFLIAWNETINQVGYFKINRIQNISLTTDKFNVSKTYNERDFIDSYGMKQNGDYYKIKLELYDLYTAISERIYGKNQTVTQINDHVTILECEMQNKASIVSFALGFGANVKVLSPEWLKEDIKHEAEKIINKYM